MPRTPHPAASKPARPRAPSSRASSSGQPGALARAFCNNEVAYLAWRLPAPIPGCLGFTVTRIIMSGPHASSRRVLPVWVAFKGQSNPDWGMQDTSVWPIQKYSWRDLTLRRLRDGSAIREPDFTCHYAITPVGHQLPDNSRAPVPAADPPITATYDGDPIPLFVCGAPLATNDIDVTSSYGPLTVSFNNGILSTQNLRQLLGVKPGRTPSKDQVTKALQDVGGKARTYLAGDILPLIHTLFDRAASDDLQLFAALYELNDSELIDLLHKHKDRLNLILTTAGHGKDEEVDDGSGEHTPGGHWDTTNAPVRPKLHQWLGDRMQDRMFNTAARIGHNKFVVLATKADPPKPVAVFTGSTNWTFTGLGGQSNNAVLVDDPAVAAGHLAYWQRLHDDKQPIPNPIDATLNGSKQGPALRTADTKPVDATLSDKTTVRSWYSPNTVRATKGADAPPDLADVFAAMDAAKQAIFMLCFDPGSPSVIGRAVAAAIARPDLLVQGAVSSPDSLPHDGTTAPRKKVKLPNGHVISIPGPAITPAELDGHKVNQLLMVRASALRVTTGDLQPEILTTGFAIIHDKIVVIDPMSERDCVVITGSHNLGYKASYCNDENLLIIRGNQKLAAAYAAHVLDVFEHYRMRAIQEERYIQALEQTGAEPAGGDRGGFLDPTDAWQTAYFQGSKGQLRDYLLTA